MDYIGFCSMSCSLLENIHKHIYVILLVKRKGIKNQTSIRLVMKKLFCRAQTPFSGRIDVCRHTGHESARDSGGM